MDHGLLFRTNIPLSWNIYGFLFRCWLGRWHPWYCFWLSGNILDRNPYFAITSYSMVIPLFGVQRNRVLFLDEVEKLNFELLPIVCVKSCELNHFSNKLDSICPQLLLHRVTIQVLLPIKESLKNETCWDLSILYQGENSFWRTYYQFCSRDWTSCWYTNKPLKEKNICSLQKETGCIHYWRTTWVSHSCPSVQVWMWSSVLSMAFVDTLNEQQLVYPISIYLCSLILQCLTSVSSPEGHVTALYFIDFLPRLYHPSSLPMITYSYAYLG